jgi:RimJ/RimL family protein N-acetyltransferase/peptidase E
MNNMRINYLFSDISKEQGFNEIQREYLKKDIKNNDTIVFIATTFDDYEKNDLYYNNLIKHFKNIDITFNKAYLIDNRVAKDLAKDYILKSNIIFLMGGDTKKQIDSVKEYDLFEILKSKEGIILGVSAGSMNQSSRVVYKNDYNNYVIEDYEGLGYIDINIYPHLDFNNIDYLKEVFEVSNYTKTVALPNDSFIRIENNNIDFVGEYYTIQNSKITMPGHEYIKINHTGTVPLETDRLVLRRTVKSDIDEFFFIQLNPNIRRYLGTNRLGDDLEKNRKYFNEEKYNELNYYRWTIVRKEDNKILGCIYLNIHDEKARTAGIDYWIREDAWGNGYTTEASRKILNFAFDTLNINRIESCGGKDNPGTYKVMEKIGLKYEGERKEGIFYYYGGLENLVLYGITKEEYKNNK